MKITRLVFLLALAFVLDVEGFATIPDSLSNRIDSLLVVAGSSEGLQKYEAEFKIAWDLFDIDNPVAVRHAGRAYEVALAVSDTVRIVTSGRLYGQLLRRTNRPYEAVAILTKLVPVAEKQGDRVEMGRILNALALVYTFQGRSDQALAAHLKSLQIYLTIHDTLRVGRSYGNIGLLYYLLGDFGEASLYFEKAFALGDSSTKSSALSNLALSHLHVGKVDSFPRLMNRSLLNTPFVEMHHKLLHYENGFGLYYLKIGSITRPSTT